MEKQNIFQPEENHSISFPESKIKRIREDFENAIYSEKKDFRIEIFNPLEDNKEYKFIYSKEGKYYLVSKKESIFQIRMHDLRKDKKPFGSILYIDGKEIQKIKTSLKIGTYFGFKKGGGEYDFFEFSEPEVSKELSKNFSSNVNNSNSDLKLTNDLSYQSSSLENFGTIKILFYDTHKESFSGLNKIFKDFKNYQPNIREYDKKFCLRNQTVRRGRNFRNRVTFVPEIDNEMKFLSNVIDFEKKIDEVFIQYQDFLSLNIMGLVIKNYFKYNIYFKD